MSSPQAEVDDPDLPKTWIKPYYGSFNGLRGLAVFSVFLSHYAVFWKLKLPQSFAWAGVDLFFVLSGFLITGILYDSLGNPRFFRDFYVRRALRIFPLFYGFFLLLFLLTPLLHLVYSRTLLTFFFYVGNLYLPFGLRLQHINPTTVSVYRHGILTEVMNIGHLWSLCIEEQFYLLWPATIFFIRDRKRLMQLCIALCILVIVTRFVLFRYDNLFLLSYMNTFTRSDTLLVGSFLALWLRGRALSRHQLRRLSLYLFAVPATIVIVMVLRLPVFTTAGVTASRFISTLGYTIIALACAGLVLRSLDDTSLLSRTLRLWPLSALGVISYGFYLIHMLPEDLLGLFAAHHPHYTVAVPVISFFLTAAVAALSFRYFETPFLKLKRILAPQHPQHPAEGAPATMHLHVPNR